MRCDSEFIQNLPGGAVCANTMSGLSVYVCVFVHVCVCVCRGGGDGGGG